jgi:hypothetical protein
MEPLKQPESIGAHSFVVPRNVIATVLDITLSAWANVQSRRVVSASSREIEIAGYLGSEMILEKRRRPGLDNQLRIEEEVGTRSAITSNKPEGRIDIKIIYSFDESEYFGVECKRVAGGTSRSAKRLSKLYVDEGIMRFVAAKYSPDHDWAAILGFVIKGSINECAALIRPHLINSHMEIDWDCDPEFGSNGNVYRTGHRQEGRSSLLTILHIFLTLTY